MTRLGRTALLLAALLALACQSGAGRFAEALPGSRLAEMQRFYVKHQPDDPRDLHLVIRDELAAHGFHVDAGKGEPQGEYDAFVTYVDRYIWDMSMYCLQLTVYFHDTETGFVTATGWSRRPSMVRKTPAGHARIIFDELFGAVPR